MGKDNLIFKLDNLEYQYHYLNNTVDSFKPRLAQTKKLYGVKGKKNAKRVEKLFNSITLDSVLNDLNKLKLQIFNSKIFATEKHLNKIFIKKLKTLKNSDNVLKVCKDDDEFVNYLIKSKLIKLSLQKLSGKKSLKQIDELPNWVHDHEFVKAYFDKENHVNPSKIWNDVVLKINEGEKITSVLMNDKSEQEVLKNFENNLNVLLGMTKEKKISKQESESEPESESELELKSTSHNKRETNEEVDSDVEISDEVDQEIDEDELIKQYQDYLVGTDDEDDKADNKNYLDPNINYNEVTDEEPSESENENFDIDDSESDSDVEQPDRKRPKLPELMTGYYSGDESASDLEEDLVAKQQASNKIQRKNRRGQRARRKIWEQKYGKQAKHVQREIEQQRAEREKRQQEYEERVAKRAAKQAERDKTNTNLIPLGVRGSNSQVAVSEPSKKTEDHPSWIAKKIAEEKLKNTKFQGKKVVFD